MPTWASWERRAAASALVGTPWIGRSAAYDNGIGWPEEPERRRAARAAARSRAATTGPVTTGVGRPSAPVVRMPSGVATMVGDRAPVDGVAADGPPVDRVAVDKSVGPLVADCPEDPDGTGVPV